MCPHTLVVVTVGYRNWQGSAYRRQSVGPLDVHLWPLTVNSRNVPKRNFAGPFKPSSGTAGTTVTSNPSVNMVHPLPAASKACATPASV